MLCTSPASDGRRLRIDIHHLILQTPTAKSCGPSRSAAAAPVSGAGGGAASGWRGAAPRSGAAARPAQPQPAQGTEQRGECGEDRGDRGQDRGEGFGGRVCGHGRSLVGGFASTRQVRARFMIVNEPPAPA